MKIILYIFFLYISILQNSILAIENKILLKVDNEIITSVDILDEINYLNSINRSLDGLDKNKIYQIARNSLIKEKIKEIALRNIFIKIELNDDDYKRLILNSYSNTGIKNFNELEKYLQNFNINKKFLKKKITINSYWNKLIYDKFSNNIKIDIDQIKENLKTKDTQKEFNISEIVFNLSENENLEKKTQLINETIEEKGFRNASLIHSISETGVSGGELGWIKESSINTEILSNINNLNLNEHTDVIKIPSGFLIIKMNDIREVKKDINIDEEVKRIIQIKTNDQLNQFSNIFFNKIKKNITINEK